MLHTCCLMKILSTDNAIAMIISLDTIKIYVTEVCCMRRIVRQPKNHEIPFPCSRHFIDHNRLGWACFDSSRINTQAQWA